MLCVSFIKMTRDRDTGGNKDQRNPSASTRQYFHCAIKGMRSFQMPYYNVCTYKAPCACPCPTPRGPPCPRLGPSPARPSPACPTLSGSCATCCCAACRGVPCVVVVVCDGWVNESRVACLNLACFEDDDDACWSVGKALPGSNPPHPSDQAHSSDIQQS